MLMRSRRPFALALLAIALSAPACQDGSDAGGDEAPDILDDSKADLLGLIDMGPIAFGTTAGTNLARPTDLQGWRFQTVVGAQLSITVNQAPMSSLNPKVYLYSPAAEGRRRSLKSDDDGGGNVNAAINHFQVRESGEYLIVVVASHRASSGGYQLTLTCDNDKCALPDSMTFEQSRIAQGDIDAKRLTPAQLFAVGDFLFEHAFTVEEGWGNALSGPQPNTNRIHRGKFGGPDSQTCARCHVVGGHDGGGQLADNMLQDGDGQTEASALVRNGRQLLGAGYLQQLGIEMTQDLQRLQNNLNCGQSVPLASKGVLFGVLTRNGSCTFDFSHVVGIDNDLVVKPLGWKGRVAELRRFVEGGFQVHLGMQAQTLIRRNCPTGSPTDAPQLSDVVGNGPNCLDPDRDGVFDEITEGQLTAMSLYAALQQVPIRIDPDDPDAVDRVRRGEELFNQVGCAGCHIPVMTLNSPVHAEKADSSGVVFNVDLTVDGREPRLDIDPDGTVTVELFSDLKRHDMGASLADAHASFGTIAPNLFMTPPLWGVAATPPYLHDGRAATLGDAISAHDGEGSDAKARFQALSADEQAKLVEFLQTLSRDPSHTND
jgi:mono/diheme cytochrome c family protein